MPTNLIFIFKISVFILGFVTFSFIGFKKPFRKIEKNTSFRFLSNFSLFMINSTVFSLLGSVTLVSLAYSLESTNIGLFNLININPLAETLIVLLLLDFAIYLQHILTHKVSFLWRLHRVHHTDPFFDTSTALRFHTLEILFSLAFKALFITLLGASAFSIVVLEISVNFFAMFNHSNFSLPSKLETLTKKILVTPDMHRIHHSTLAHETNSNYGFSFSFWDKLFGTYTAEPTNNPQTMNIGQNNFSSTKSQSLKELLLQPFNSLND